MKVYLTSAEGVHTLLDEKLREKLGAYELQKNAFGKPYVRGNPVFFNLSHSGDFGAVALSCEPVGVDIEAIKGRDHKLLISRFCEAERAEIRGEADFLAHFTAREAYVKYLGQSIYEKYGKISFVGGYIRVNGEKQDEKITTFVRDDYVFSVCGDGEIEIIEI